MFKSIALSFSACLLFACSSLRKVPEAGRDGKLKIEIVQVNDVYEIAPVSGGSEGGLARIASVKKDVLAKNPNTLLVMAGDFLSPSVYNSLRYEGKRIRGAQMIDAMNSAAFDIAIFGNHEFDIAAGELQERLNESKFRWIASNVFRKDSSGIHPFMPASLVLSFKDAYGTSVNIGFIGITLYTSTSNYTFYTDPFSTAAHLCDSLKKSCDAVIAITHQTVADDSILAARVPGISLIIGGHEHDMRFKKIGNTYITKAHSNARSAYLLNIEVNKLRKKVKVRPALKYLDSSVAPDPATAAVVKRWTDRANENYSSLGFDPSAVVLAAGDSLEGRDNYTRRTSTNLTELIVNSMQWACPQADIVVINSGSIRIDDILYPPVSQYDVLRTLPFGGSIREVEMKGSLLEQVLTAGEQNRTAGGYLQHSRLNGPLDTAAIYRVAMSDFLLTGGESNLGFLTPQNPLITKVYGEETSPADPRSDIRLAIVKYLESSGRKSQ